MQLIHFKSDPKRTPFAPEWSWIMGEDESLSDSSYLNSLREIILSKETHVISENTEKYNNFNTKNDIKFDGDTGLGEYSLTSRSPFFNVLSWDNPEIKSLNSFLKFKYIEFLQAINVPRQKTWIQCWANVMRDGEEIKQHIHASHPLTWLGGHLTIACNNTSTFYVNPMMRAEGKQVHESVNVPGKLTLFQNNIPHFTNKHIGPSERISIAFDIIVDERYYQYDQERRTNFIVFDEGL